MRLFHLFHVDFVISLEPQSLSSGFLILLYNCMQVCRSVLFYDIIFLQDWSTVRRVIVWRHIGRAMVQSLVYFKKSGKRFKWITVGTYLRIHPTVQYIPHQSHQTLHIVEYPRGRKGGEHEHLTIHVVFLKILLSTPLVLTANLA